MNFSALRRAGRARRRTRDGLALVALVLLAAVGTQCTNTASRRVDLVVLVLTDGANPGVIAVRDELRTEGVPFREINVADPAHPTVDAAFLATTSGTSPVVERARYQAVVSADEEITGLSPDERTALIAYEIKYGIRHVTAGTWSKPAVGLNEARTSGYIGTLDGMTATVTPAGRAAPFTYLAGPVPFEAGSYGHLATPLDSPPAGASYSSLVTVPIPGTNRVGSIVGVYQHDGRQEMVITALFNSGQQQFRALGHGIVTWMTKGVHLGHDRNYLTVHVDDIYGTDTRWNSANNCTPDSDCPAGVAAGPEIRMTAADVAAVAAWQTANGFTLDWAFNGYGSDEWAAEHGSDPLLAATTADAGRFHWINHTYRHQFLGCQQDMSVIPWRCRTGAGGQTLWVSQATIVDEINQNVAFARAHGLPIDPAELVTGEHSGLFILPQQPVDNPNLAPAFTATGITVTGADASRQPDSRVIGTTRTVPRYPMANYFNVGTKAEMADEYNWVFTSKAAGGSGACTDNPKTMTCITPIDPATGYDSYIVPQDTTLTMRHVLGNDPRPHYVHQSNLAEDRILLPLMSSVLARYRSMMNATAPPVHVTETEAASALARQAAWAAGAAGAGQVEAYTVDNTVHVDRGAFTGAVPITVPAGSRVDGPTGTPFGEAYAGESSAWVADTGSYRVALASGP
jgi:hypothetical protein